MINHKEGKSGSILDSDRSAPDLVPDLVPKYMVTVDTRWYLLGLAAAPLYQRVPTSPNSHKHFQDSNSLGGTIKPQVRVPE
jgi:hypothetical protein